MRRLGIAAALLALLAVASLPVQLVPARAETVQATQFWALMLFTALGDPIGYYVLTGTGEAWLHTNGEIIVVFNNGTTVQPPAGTYNYTSEDIVVRLEWSANTGLSYAQVYNYTFDGRVEVSGIKGDAGGLVAGIIACGFVNATITPINTDSYAWQPSTTVDNNTLVAYARSGTRNMAASIPVLGCSTWYAYEVYAQKYDADVTIGANITASDWGIYAPTPSTVTVTTTATTTATVTETVTEAATMTVTETVSLAATETTVPATIDYGRLAAIGAGLAFVLLLIIASLVRR